MLNLAIIFVFLNISSFNAQNIVRHSCGSEAAFYKIASDHALDDPKSFTIDSDTGILGCIDACVYNSSCKAFNSKKLTENKALCELLQNDRNTNAAGIVASAGWNYYDTGLYKSKVGQWCSSQKYNPCYPCRCFDSCFSSNGYTCNCTSDMPKRPNIYLAFEETMPDNTNAVPYNRGKNVNQESIVTLANGAKIGSSTGRPGKVLKLVGTNAYANAGNFNSHVLNNPSEAKFTLSLWVKIGTPYSGTQVICASGKVSSNSGILIKVTNSAKTLTTRVIMSSYHVSTSFDVKDTLQTWTHLAIVYKGIAPVYLKTYVNGRKVQQTSTKTSHVGSSTGYSKLNFGAGGVTTFANENWNMHIDDVAYWDYAMTRSKIQFIQTQGNVL